MHLKCGAQNSTDGTFHYLHHFLYSRKKYSSREHDDKNRATLQSMAHLINPEFAFLTALDRKQQQFSMPLKVQFILYNYRTALQP